MVRVKQVLCLVQVCNQFVSKIGDKAMLCNPISRAKAVFRLLAFILFSIIAISVSAQAQAVDWVVNIDDSGSDPIPAGGTITYNITVANNGNSAAPATTIDLTVDAGTTLTATSGTISGCAAVPTVGPGTVTCNVPALAAFASTDLAVEVLTTTQGTTNFGASVPVAGDDNGANNAATESTTVTTAADIDLTVSGPATAGSGSLVTYSYTATNTGPNTANSFTFSFPIPTGLANITPPAGCVLAGSTYSCAINGPIAVGDSVVLDFTGQISAASGSTVTPLASVNSVSPDDPITANNTVSMDTAVTAGSDVTLTKSRAPAGILLVGDTATFTLSPSYTGDTPNTLTISDTVPANYTITTASPFVTNGWNCTVVGQQIDCTKTSGSGAGVDVSLGDVVFDTVVASSGNPTNTATIAAAGPSDPFPGNNTATDGGAVIEDPTVDLRANKSGPVPALVVVGQQYNFSISATNIGNADFFGTLVMTDHLPAGMTVDSYALNGWSCTPAAPVAGATDITCERTYTAGAPLAAGATAPSVGLTTTATATGSLVNGMTVSSPDANIADLNPANDTITYGVGSSTAGDSADVSLIKNASLATVVAGEVQTFTLEIVNAGPQPSQNVTLLDNFTGLMNSNVGATGAGYISEAVVANAATGISCSTTATGGTSRQLSCTINTLPVCAAGVDCPVVTVSVRPGGNGGARTNSASGISNTTADPTLANNTDTAGYTVDARADVTVTKDGTPNPVKAGQNLTYVLTAINTNNGLSAADAVTVTDTLPADLTFVSASPSAGSCSTVPNTTSPTGPGNDQIVCNLGTINNGSQQTITVVVRPNTATRGTTLVNNASVSTSTTETDTGNNTASLNTPVEDPVLDLLVNKSESVDPLPVGDTTVYTVTVTNLGPSTAENIVLTDVMPPALISFQSHTVDADGSCSAVPAANSYGGTLTCSFPVVLAGETKTVTITGLGTGKGVATNSASISSDELVAGFDTNPGNNTTTEDTTVRTKADVEVASKVATPNPTNLLDNFDFVIQVRNNAGPGLTEADDVSVTDSLPANMVLTGTPSVTSGAGSVTSTACTGAAGGTSFSCDLGTFANGGVVEITVPVKVTSISSQGQVFNNSATISTSSFDTVPGNNSNSGAVTVNGSSIGGQLYRDFNDNGIVEAGDTGVGGVTITLTGTDKDGNAVSRTVVTAPDGSYSFDLLPEGNYTITRGNPSEPNYSDGTDTPGTAGGTASAPDAISNVALGGNVAATDYLFAIVPTASIGIAKSVTAGPTPNADGSFNVTYRMIVENLSLEDLNNITVTDQLAGAAPAHGTYVALGAPATDPMARGDYTILAAPSGSCAGLNGGFNGSGNTTVASGATLAVGATCQIDITLRVQPTVPFPAVQPSGGRYENQAVVTGEGVLSGQTSATNPMLADLSDNGSNPDPDGDRNANEGGENDVTPVAPAFNSSIALVKTADTSALSVPSAINDVISYSFTVTNTGDVTLTNITISDPLPGIVLSGGPIASLAPGASDTVTFTATYQITQADIDAGEVVNQATVQGTDPFDNVVTDQSGTNTGNDTPTTAVIPQNSGIALIKVADASGLSNPSVAGETITYSFTVTNTGNTTLSNVTLADPLPGIVISGGPIASLAPGAVDNATFTASYQVTLADINAGQVQNQATVTADDPAGNPVTDLSGDTNADDNPVVVPLHQAPAIALVKTADTAALSSPPLAGETITYHFAITNTGNVSLSNVTITDILPGIVINGGPIPNLDPGVVDSATISATYTLTQADIDAGQVVNHATVTGADPTGNPVTDQSGTTNGDDNPTTTPLAQSSSIALVKTADISALSPDPVAGETITYHFAITNTGNVTLTNVGITDILPGIVINGGPIASLAPGAVDSATISATYVLTQADVDAGQVVNQATATGTDPSGNPVSDLSGTTNGDDTPLTTLLDRGPQIALVKTADTAALSNPPVAGETITYHFAITNTGNVTLTNVGITDILPGIVISGGPIASLAPGAVDSATISATYVLTQADVDAGQGVNQATATGTDPSGNPVSDLSGTTNGDDTPLTTPLVRTPSIALVKTADTSGFSVPTTVGDQIVYSFTVTNTGNVTLTNVTISDVLPGIVLSGGPIASLTPGAVDSATFTATYALTQADIDAGEVVNQATVSGSDPDGNPVTDLSGSDAASDNPTQTPIPQTPAIELVKTADMSGFPNGVAQEGDTVPYSFTITNTGNVTLTNVTLTDPLPGIVLAGGPIATMAPGAVDSVTYTATYTVTAADLANGTVDNTATATGQYGTDGGGNPLTVQATDTESFTVVSVEALPEVYPPFTTDGGTTTSVLTSDTHSGGPATLTNVTIAVISTDPEVTLDPATGLITLSPGNPAGEYTVTYEICSVIAPTVCDQTTETVVQGALPAIETTKTQTLIDNGDGIDGVGDQIVYTITVENTGNVPLENLALTDTFTAIDGTPLTLDSGPTFGSASMGSTVGNLQIGEVATYTASFTLTIEAVSGGGVSNSVEATGLPVFGPGVPGVPSPVSDISDDGIDTDGNIADDPTELAIAPSLAPTGLVVEKTTPRGVVERGSIVPYTITVTNNNPVVSGTLNIVDVLPPGLLYVPGSATLNGVAAPVTVSGRVITWVNVPVPPLTTVTATIQARVTTGANAGELVNTASIRNPATNGLMAPVATATVRILPEPVFDCGDVIGKVFDDENRDGYQNKGEKGIPSVRLAGVDGTIITTDEFGRFHVPCAMLPADHGSNFILKIDTRSLPSGYRLTTENPRVVRLTPGKMTEINFGVSITRVVRIDINANAFIAGQGGNTEMSPALLAGIAKLLPRIAAEPVNLRIAYHIPKSAGRDEVKRARAQMRLVEKHIRHEWRDIGQVKLTIEQLLLRVGQ